MSGFVLPKRVRDKIRFRHATQPGFTACWIWTGTVDDGGYGRTSDGAEKLMAHRYVYEHLRAPIPAGTNLKRHCPNTGCVNPNHWELKS